MGSETYKWNDASELEDKSAAHFVAGVKVCARVCRLRASIACLRSAIPDAVATSQTELLCSSTSGQRDTVLGRGDYSFRDCVTEVYDRL